MENRLKAVLDKTTQFVDIKTKEEVVNYLEEISTTWVDDKVELDSAIETLEYTKNKKSLTKDDIIVRLGCETIIEGLRG